MCNCGEKMLKDRFEEFMATEVNHGNTFYHMKFIAIW